MNSDEQKNDIKKSKLFKRYKFNISMFFLPLGYDLLFKTLLNITGNFWATDIIFYCLSGGFWLLYWALSKYSNRLKT